MPTTNTTRRGLFILVSVVFVFLIVLAAWTYALTQDAIEERNARLTSWTEEFPVDCPQEDSCEVTFDYDGTRDRVVVTVERVDH